MADANSCSWKSSWKFDRVGRAVARRTRDRQEPAWCAASRNGSTNRGFYTYEQCMATVSEIGGFCNPSPDAERKNRPCAGSSAVEPKPRRKEKTSNVRRRRKIRARLRLPHNRHLRLQPAARRDGAAAAGAATGRRPTGPARRGRSRLRPPRNSRAASERRARSFSPENMKPASRPCRRSAMTIIPTSPVRLVLPAPSLEVCPRRGRGTPRRWLRIQITSRPWATPARFTCPGRSRQGARRTRSHQGGLRWHHLPRISASSKA